MSETIQKIAILVKPTLQKYGVKYAGLFGSYARGDARSDSDIDILVSLGEKVITLWDFVAFRSELSDVLKKPVDLVSDRAVVPYFREYIDRDLKLIYGSKH